MQRQNKFEKNMAFLLIIITLFIGFIISRSYEFKEGYIVQNNSSESIEHIPVSSSAINNLQLIDELLNNKLADLSTFGYFPQVYEPSL